MKDYSSEQVFEAMAVDEARYPGKNTFDLFLELIADFPVRCSFEYKGSDPFHSRWLSAQVGPGTAIRWSCAAHATARTENDVADSIARGYGILYVLSGRAQVIQDGKEIEANPGCAVIYDLDVPGQVNMLDRDSGEFAFIAVPRHIAHASAPAERYRNPMRLITNRTPLLQCVDYLSRVLSTRAAQQLEHVYKACSSLFTAEFLLAQNDDASRARSTRASTDLLARMLVQIDREAGNSDLSPEWLAARFGVSVRHVHKLFAKDGMTCQSYIKGTRLNYARKDLIASLDKIRIATLAYRWGFTDPSAFGRAFRNRFGCSPGEFQTQIRSKLL